jgi:hypothetical protein
VGGQEFALLQHIIMLYAAGFEVMYVCSDGHAVNVLLNKIMCGQERDSTGGTKRFFEHPITKGKIYTGFDGEHLGKCARNNAFKSSVVGGKGARDIREAFFVPVAAPEVSGAGSSAGVQRSVVLSPVTHEDIVNTARVSSAFETVPSVRDIKQAVSPDAWSKMKVGLCKTVASIAFIASMISAYLHSTKISGRWCKENDSKHPRERTAHPINLLLTSPAATAVTLSKIGVLIRALDPTMQRAYAYRSSMDSRIKQCLDIVDGWEKTRRTQLELNGKELGKRSANQVGFSPLTLFLIRWTVLALRGYLESLEEMKAKGHKQATVLLSAGVLPPSTHYLECKCAQSHYSSGKRDTARSLSPL